MKWPTLRWIGKRLKDLLYGPGNRHLDLGRVVSLIANLTMLAGVCWNIHLGREINLQALGLGWGGLITACGALIKWKDAEKRKAEAVSVEAEREA